MSAINIDETVAPSTPGADMAQAVPSASPKASRGPVKLTRNLSLAREAFTKGDIEKSRLAHEPRTLVGDDDDCIVPGEVHGAEQHNKSGEYVRSIVFGAMDGIITTFAIVAGSRGANLSSVNILVLGFANVIADGISMGFGDFISSQAENDYARREWQREKFELEHFPIGEKLEMIELYEAKGMTREDATQVIETMSKYSDLFVDHMVVHELGLHLPDEFEQEWKNGLITFVAFAVFGTVPLLSYIGFHALHINAGFDLEFLIACILTAICLFALGVYKSRFVCGRWWTSGLWVLLNGSLAAAAAYLVGWGLGALLGSDQQCAGN